MKALLIGFMILFLGLAYAEDLSGIFLYKECHSDHNVAEAVGCVAYIHGFLDGMVTGRVGAEKMSGTFCPPKDGISVDQGRLIIEKYMKDHPGELNQQAGIVVAGAMYDAFPCQ
jgi:hypothetical protein